MMNSPTFSKHNSLSGRTVAGAHPATAVTYGSGTVDSYLTTAVYEIYFLAINTAFEINCNQTNTFNSIDKGTKCNGVSYSTNDGSSWTSIVLTLSSGNLYTINTPIVVSAGNVIKFRVDSFSGSYTDGTLILSATKS